MIGKVCKCGHELSCDAVLDTVQCIGCGAMWVSCRVSIDLLSALREVTERLYTATDAEDRDPEEAAMIQRARAAIQKATGAA